MLARLDHAMQQALDWAIITLAGLLLILLNYAVFARFVLNASVSWGEELPAYLLATLTFLGAAYLTRKDEHIGFDGVVRLMPPSLQKMAFLINLTAMTAFGLALTYYGSIAAWRFLERPLISIDIPMIIFRAAMPLGALLITIICATRLAALATGRIQPQDLLPKTDD